MATVPRLPHPPTPPGGAVFVGRAEPLAVLAHHLELVRGGAPQIVAVVGEGGLGKTTLVRRFLADAGVTTLWASGDELETDLSFGVADQMLAAVGAGPVPPDADHLGAGAALLDALGQLESTAGGEPVAVVLDDAGLADTASLQALTFALRRLRADSVLTVLTLRPEQVALLPDGLLRHLDAGHGCRLPLRGMEPGELTELVSRLTGADLAPAAVRTIADHTGGNPLHVRALAEELGPEALASAGAGTPLPAPRTFAALVLGRLATCSPDTERLVATLATAGLRAPLAVCLTAAEPADPEAAVDEACATGLVAVEDHPLGTVLALTHPLVRSAIHHDLARGRRAELHRRLAGAVPDEGARLRHLALATPGPDPELAARLAAHADAELARSMHAAPVAATAFREAARLAGDPAASEHLLLRALETLLLAGDAGRAAELAPFLDGLPDSPRKGLNEGVLALTRGDFASAAQRLQAAWARCDDTTPVAVRASIAGPLAPIALNSGSPELAIVWAERALAGHATPEEADPSGMTALTLALALGSSGRADEAHATVGDAPGPGPLGVPDLARLTAHGVMALWTDRLGEARELLGRAAAEARRLGAFLPGAVASYYLAEAEFRAGRWDDAATRAETVASAAVDADQRWYLALPHGVAALPHAARGDWERAEHHAAAAAEGAAAVGDYASALWAHAARIAVDRARGDHAAVADTGRLLVALPDEVLRTPVSIRPWRIDVAEALAALGRPEEGWEVLRPGGDPDPALPATAGALHRARAALHLAAGDGDAAEAAFAAGRVLLDASEDPFQTALFHLADGAHLRRRGQRRDAADTLERARAVLADLGARPWLARVEEELRAAGRTVDHRHTSPVDALTAQEQAVANLVAAGKRNRDVAAELYVSVKTVEYHLGNVYRKLGITSRSQLAARLQAPRA